MQRVAVIDYGGSNLRSVQKAFEFVSRGRHDIIVTDRRDAILSADRIVFPGQGAIGDCMTRLEQRRLAPLLRECIGSRPFLGICLGLQSLVTDSDEDGGVACLGVYAGHVRRFSLDPGPAPDGSLRKIPHMGWNNVSWTKPHPLIDGIASGTRFYFVHSYHVVPDDDAIVMARTEYIGSFVSAVAAGNVFAVQFHPEKSARGGLKLLENFLAWNGEV